MKKKMFVCMAIALTIGLTACGKSDTKTNATEATTTVDASEKDTTTQESDADAKEKNETKATSETEEDSKLEETSEIETDNIGQETDISASGTESTSTETEPVTETGSEEETTIPTDEALAKDFYEKAYGDMSDTEMQDLLLERSEYFENSSYYEVALQFWEEVRGVTDTSYKQNALYYTDMRYYTEEDFEDVPLDILILARNEIYAKHGYRFKDENLENYFMGCLWYQPLESNEDFNEATLNDYEKQNMEVLDKLIKAE